MSQRLPMADEHKAEIREIIANAPRDLRFVTLPVYDVTGLLDEIDALKLERDHLHAVVQVYADAHNAAVKAGVKMRDELEDAERT